MKHFMDVIARKRPLPQDPGRGAAPPAADPAALATDLPADLPADLPPDLPRAAAPRTEPLDPRAPVAAPDLAEAPQIWDLDPPDPAEDAAPEPPPPAAEPLRRRRIGAAAPPPAATPASRARTRVLGFAAAELAHDVFAGERVAPGAVARFPAGWIVVVEGPGRGASFTLGAGVSTIGRAPDQTVALDFGDMAISREMHASIAYDEEQNRFFVGHGGKSNIVRRNGAPVLATEELFHGDILRIGRTALRFIALCGPEFTWGDRAEDEA